MRVVAARVPRRPEPVVDRVRLADRADLQDRAGVEVQTGERGELLLVLLLELLDELLGPGHLRVQLVERVLLLGELGLQRGLRLLDLLEGSRRALLELLLLVLAGRQGVADVLDLRREVGVLLAQGVHVLHPGGQVADRGGAEQELEPRGGAGDVGVPGALLQIVPQPLVLHLRVGQRGPRVLEVGRDLLPLAVRGLLAFGDALGLEQERADDPLLRLDLTLELLELRLGVLELLLGGRLGERDLRGRRQERQRRHHREGAAEHDGRT